MKTQFYYLCLSLVVLINGYSLAQCPNNNSPYGSISSLSPGQTGTVYCMYGGEYATVNVTNGATYTFSTCGGSWDSQLTLYTTGGSFLAYNDDACGLQSEITWTSSFSGQVRVMLDRYYCTNFYSCMNLNVTRLGNGPSNPCQNSESLSCNNTESYNLGSGNGAWNPPGPWGTPGNEQVFEFTATTTGVHQIQVTHSGGYFVDLFIKSGGCNQNGWTYVDDIYSSSTNYITLNAGTTYQFLIDDENTSSSSGTISITCPNPAANPCNSVTSLSCGTPTSYSLSSGSGAWNPSGPWGTPGNEQVFSYTPTVSGAHAISVNHSGGYYVDLFYKSGTCGPTGWTYVDDIFSSSTNNLNLVAGVTYHFLIDDENTSSSNGSIQISCPCAGNLVDQTVTLSSNMTLFDNTSGACNDCSLRSSQDITFEIDVPCAGTYTFSTCGNASWDTYLYLTSQPCSGVIALNDDNCGLQSTITSYLSAGTYYLTVEGFSSSSSGAFGVAMTRACNLNLSIGAQVMGCGYNVSCNGDSDGMAYAMVSGACGQVDYVWSNGTTSSQASGLSAGQYSLAATDQFGCTANASITLTEPDPLIADAGADETVYYGYTPMSCADLSGDSDGGCGPYTYAWMANGSGAAIGSNATVCPSASTDYTLVVTDANGCTASDDMTVCVVDVICYAGNSGNQKVEMCQIPPGNPNNAHTICVSPSAVPAHLAIGCTLGACDEMDVCAPAARNMSVELPTQQQVSLNAYPNPFSDDLTINMVVPRSDNYSLSLRDVTGKLISHIFNGSLFEGESIVQNVNVSDLSPGVYIIFLQSQSEIRSYRVVRSNH